MRPMRTIISIAIACLALLAPLFLWQDRLLYFPERTTLQQMASVGLRLWPAAQDFRGLLAEPAGAAHDGDF